jgi:glycosyltransferase involved in cell wall biosynthesis
MKLLVLAQTPPPLHGQSVMVGALVRGLPTHGIAVHHVNLRLSRDSSDIGRWSMRKVLLTLGAACRTILARFSTGCTTLYYVPAPPGKRGALYRDWILMFLCRPFYRRLVLHWHAAGLGRWLESDANRIERVLTRLLLGRADLAIALADPLRHDAEFLHARRIVTVPNGIHNTNTILPPPADSGRALFLGLCSEEKGLFAAASAVLEANRRSGRNEAAPAFTLTAAGPFNNPVSEARFHALCARFPRCLKHVGVASESVKEQLFAECQMVLLPTHYPAEAFPLVALEALAHDRPIIATRWRGLPDIVTPDVGLLVPVDDHAALVAALLEMRAQPPLLGTCRARYEAHYTLDRHLTALATALSQSSAKRDR